MPCQNWSYDASPLGLYAGDTNLYRFVEDDPTNLVDPTGLTSRNYWQRKANDVIGWKESGKNPGPIEMNRRITAAYAEMYLRDPSKFVWAGMAAFASNEVGKGMKTAEILIEEAGSIGILYGLTLGLAWFFVDAPYGTDLLDALKTGNLGVYQDIYWMHLAYASCGIEEMRRLRDQGELSPELYKAWELIDQGKVWEGNRLLLKYEQQITLQRQVYDKNAKTFKDLSKLSKYMPSSLKSPIPSDDNTFQKIVPGGNIGDFNDRWKWIDTSMLPAWKKIAIEDPERVKKLMQGFLRGKYK